MCRAVVCLVAAVVAAAVCAAPAIAQNQADAITSINGENLASDAAIVYFNAENCADPATTVYDLTLTNADSVRQAFLWAGVQNAGCEQNNNRTDVQQLCRPMADSTPATVGDNTTIFSLTLQELVDTGIVDCENTALQGQPYEIYAFRNEDPGGNDVTVEGFGVAPFTVDVTPPDQLDITSGSEQTGSQFTISWSAPADSESIAEYRLYSAVPGGSCPAEEPNCCASPMFTGITAGATARSLSVTAASLGLAAGDQIDLCVSAVDEASVNLGDGNEGELSEATLATAADTFGFCDDPSVDCSGCTVSPMLTHDGRPGSGPWAVALVFVVVAWRRLRR